MTGRTAPPGNVPARAIEQQQEQTEGRPEGPARPRGRFERDAAAPRARAGSGRAAARPVPIRPAAERTHRLVLTGRLAHDSAPALEAALDELCDAGIGELVLDLGALRGIDETGMKVIAMRCALCRRRGIAVRVERLGGALLEAFGSAGLLAPLPLHHPADGPAEPGRAGRR